MKPNFSVQSLALKIALPILLIAFAWQSPALETIPPSELGDWNDVIHTTAFLLFRKTELYRGELRLVVRADEGTDVQWQADGTLMISSGLLDRIDADIFETIASSNRRIRNFDYERELRLAPEIAFEAARAALGLQATSSEPAANNLAFGADSFAPILLQQAGYPVNLYEEALAKKGIPERIKAFAAARETIARLSGEIRGIFASLLAGDSSLEARASANALCEDFPSSPYFQRLSALLEHRAWELSVGTSGQTLITLYPYSGNIHVGRQLAFLNQPKTGTAVFSNLRSSGDRNAWKNAANRYKQSLESWYDYQLASSYALLLASSPEEADRSSAVGVSAEAAEIEEGKESWVARGNRASVLFTLGMQSRTARKETESVTLLRDKPVKKLDGLIREGYPSDVRNLFINNAMMLASEGQTGDNFTAAAALARTGRIGLDVDERERAAIRGIRIGDSFERLAEAWGKPAEIQYHYSTEVWYYPSLDTMVHFSTDKGSQSNPITLIMIGPLSPISIGFDLRAGDDKELFEAYLGAPLYRANDCEAYEKDGNTLTVLYGSGTARFITVY